MDRTPASRTIGLKTCTVQTATKPSSEISTQGKENMLPSRSGLLALSIFSLSIVALACTCNLSEALQPSTPEPLAAEGSSGSARATLNTNPESALEPTLAPPPTEAPTTQLQFYDSYFAGELGEAGEPLLINTTFPHGTSIVYAIASWSGMQDGTPARSAWYIDGELATESEFDWSLGSAGSDTYVAEIHSTDGDLPPGSYTWELSVGGQALASSSFSIPDQGQAGVLLQDDFSDPNSGWEVANWEEGSVTYENGTYAVSAISEDKTIWGNANVYFESTVIQFTTQQVEGPANHNNAYGVICRESEGGLGYFLRISGDGFYSIQLSTEHGSFKPLVDWTKSEAIHQGNAVNRVRAVCDGPNLALYANDVLLSQIADDTLVSGDIALTATTYEAEATKVLFDDVEILSP